MLSVEREPVETQTLKPMQPPLSPPLMARPQQQHNQQLQFGAVASVFEYDIAGENWQLLYTTDGAWVYLNTTTNQVFHKRPEHLLHRTDIDNAIANYVTIVTLEYDDDDDDDFGQHADALDKSVSIQLGGHNLANVKVSTGEQTDASNASVILLENEDNGGQSIIEESIGETADCSDRTAQLEPAQLLKLLKQNEQNQEHMNDDDLMTTCDFLYTVVGTNWTVVHSIEGEWFYTDTVTGESVYERPIELLQRSDVDKAIADSHIGNGINNDSEKGDEEKDRNDDAVENGEDLTDKQILQSEGTSKVVVHKIEIIRAGDRATADRATIDSVTVDREGVRRSVRHTNHFKCIRIDSDPKYVMDGKRRQYKCRYCSKENVDRTKNINHETGCFENPQMKIQMMNKGFMRNAAYNFQCLLCPHLSTRTNMMYTHIRSSHGEYISGNVKRYQLNIAGLIKIIQNDQSNEKEVGATFSLLPKILTAINGKLTSATERNQQLREHFEVLQKKFSANKNLAAALNLAKETARRVDRLDVMTRDHANRILKNEVANCTNVLRLNRTEARVEKLEAEVSALRARHQ